jgi:hypothetical protein
MGDHHFSYIIELKKYEKKEVCNVIKNIRRWLNIVFHIEFIVKFG